MAGKIAVVVIAVGAMGYALLSRPATVQPKRPSTHQAALTPPPAPAAVAPAPVQAQLQAQAPAPVPAPAIAPAPASIPAPEVELPKAADAPGKLVRQVVDYISHEAPGTVVVDTGNTFLYLVLNGKQAMRYGIGVGREGFTWSGEQTVARKTEWPDWRPPAEMVLRQPYLPRFMAGGPGNPLGARAMYLGETEYRIHGTNKPDTIGKRVSSGCIRLTNDDVTDLYERVKVGAKVIVLPATRAIPAAHRVLRSNPDEAANRLPNPGLATVRPAT
ncbi:L,D-transpeptidase [Bradyrhizobium sp. dw_411]|uniref:L,D-transpeptidase n=1 Tax=Bradyrhizobium sp. dw_411 TaxID=2720082 RepID=UPI001BCDD3AC|nr:L,D-transpeptidase [Bradyrhizobium sp. dw_411]